MDMDAFSRQKVIGKQNVSRQFVALNHLSYIYVTSHAPKFTHTNQVRAGITSINNDKFTSLIPRISREAVQNRRVRGR